MRRTSVSLLLAALAAPLLSLPASPAAALPAAGPAGPLGVVALIEGPNGLEVRTFPATSAAEQQALIAQLDARPEVAAVSPAMTFEALQVAPSPDAASPDPSLPVVESPSPSPESSTAPSETAAPTPSESASGEPTESANPSPEESAPGTESPSPEPTEAAPAYPDPYAAQQWALRTLKASEAWAKAAENPQEAAKGVTVAVIDDGVDGSHPDFLDSTGTSVVLPAHDAVQDREKPVESHHGTHVAGIIGAVSNDVGVAGIAPGVKILPVNVFDGEEASNADITRAILHATSQDVKVINLSLGAPAVVGSPGSDVLQRAIAEATRKGILVVAAAGNSAAPCTEGELGPDCGNTLSYPAALQGVLAVGAQYPDGKIAEFSQHNPYLDLSAPGVCIVSVASRQNPAEEACEEVFPAASHPGAVALHGTSMAAPYVSGAAAVVQAHWTRQGRSLAPELLAHHLQATADDAGTPGRDEFHGDGNLNLLSGLTETPAAITAGGPALRVPTRPVVVAAKFKDPETGEVFAIVNYLGLVSVSGTPAAPGGQATDEERTLAELLSDARGEGTMKAHCFPLAGEPFLVGDTTVNCTAVDAEGRTGYGRFVVRVSGPGSSTPVPDNQVRRFEPTGVPVPRVVHAG